MKVGILYLVFGKLCSGKGKYCAELAHKENCVHYSASTFVKKISKLQTRSQLQHTADLWQQIAKEMILEAAPILASGKNVIIEGIRQPNIVTYLQDHMDNFPVKKIWLDVPDDIRKFRFLSRADAKDDQAFDEANQGDINLGIDDVEKQFKHLCDVVNYYSKSELPT